MKNLKLFVISLLLLLFLLPTLYSQTTVLAQNDTATPTPKEEEPTRTPVATAAITGIATRATPSPSPTQTPVATGATPSDLDPCEPNDDFDVRCPVLLNQTLAGLTLAPLDDRDYFQVYLKAGQIGRAATFPAPGTPTDTRLSVYSAAGALLGQNDDRSAIDLGSTVVWTAPAEGWYVLLVESAVPLAGHYDLLVSLELPTMTTTPTQTLTPAPTGTPAPTATSQPTLTPIIQPDAGEPNNNPESAWEAVAGMSYPMTLGPAGVDSHDFFRVLVKAGNRYRCAAEEPGGVDPAMRVYAGNIGSGVLLAENDDISPADVGSAVHFNAPYDGHVYVVVEVRAGYGRYNFGCEAVIYSAPAGGVGGTPTPAVAGMTPIPAIAGATIVATTPPIQLSIRPLPAVVPTATPATLTTIRLQVIYDLNANGRPDPDEGIASISVRALSRNASVGWILTDERGLAVLTILGEVDQVIVPFLAGWQSEIRPGLLNEAILSVPAVPLPVVMPVGMGDGQR